MPAEGDESMPPTSATTEPREWYHEGLTFSCTQCGNCCTGPPGFVWASIEEQHAIARRLGLPLDQFRKQYARRIGKRWSLEEVYNPQQRGYDCVFLVRDPQTGKAGCSIYEDRPAQCRTWPFWPENLESHRTWRTVARNCPGVANGMSGDGNFYPIEQIRIIRDQTPSL